MKFIVLFEDSTSAAPDIRSKHMKEHLAFLEKHAAVIEAAGPLSDPKGKGRDGLWLVKADSVGEVDRLVREDPFWPTGLRESYSVIAWTQVYPRT